MEKYLTRYQNALKQFEEAKRQMMNEIVNLFQTLQINPIAIGNGIYYTCDDFQGRVVPAYLDSVSVEFKPIYDEEMTYDFGWADFDQCARLFDVIRERILSKTK